MPRLKRKTSLFFTFIVVFKSEKRGQHKDKKNKGIRITHRHANVTIFTFRLDIKRD